MSALDTLFRDLRAAKRKALMPFVTAGDPDLQFTADLLRCLIARGSSLCELGIPYSDPIADGPVIQSSYTRALQHKVKLAEIFDMLGRVTPELKAPLVSMVSYSIIYRQGLEAYVTAAAQGGGGRGDRARLAGRGIGRAGRGLPPPGLFAHPVDRADDAPRAGLADCRAHQRLHLLCLGDRHHRRADRIAAGDPGQRGLAPRSDAAADLHRFRHQPAGARADARAGGRRSDRRFGDRASRGRGLDPARGRPCCKRSATTSPSCSPRWSSVGQPAKSVASHLGCDMPYDTTSGISTNSPPARVDRAWNVEIDVVGHGPRGTVGPEELGQVRMVAPEVKVVVSVGQYPETGPIAWS